MKTGIFSNGQHDYVHEGKTPELPTLALVVRQIARKHDPLAKHNTRTLRAQRPRASTLRHSARNRPTRWVIICCDRLRPTQQQAILVLCETKRITPASKKRITHNCSSNTAVITAFSKERRIWLLN